MESIDILIWAISIAILAPFILVSLMMIAGVILYTLGIIGSIMIIVWEFGCKTFKNIKK